MFYRSRRCIAPWLCAGVLVAVAGGPLHAQDDDDEIPARRGAAPPAAPAAPAPAAKEAPPAEPVAAAPVETPAEPTQPPAVEAPPPAPAGPRVVQAGAYPVESRGPWTAEDRLSSRPPELWLAYMHGVVDQFAKPACWEDLLASEQPAETWLDKTAPLQGNPWHSCPMPALRLAAKQELVTGRALIPAAELRALAGKTVRVFVWLSARDSGQDRYLWNAVPRLDILFVNASGRVFTALPGTMATRGTFPWHCYYREVIVPDPARLAETTAETAVADELVRAGGLYLRLLNPASGMAWFSTPSWEVLEAANTFPAAALQDPLTGSMAPNARFDELPVHLSSPQVCYRDGAAAYEWAFLAGARRGAVNVPNVLDKEGLAAYIETAARRDPHHLIQGLTRLPEWYRTGAAFKCLPLAEPDLLAFLGSRMVAAQDAETGFWGYEKKPRSMAVTAAVVLRMFGGDAFRRADRPPMAQSWLTCGETPLPNPEPIVKTVLGLQGPGADKQRGKGGWSTMATSYANAAQVLGAGASCSLAATADAVFLLRRCSEGLPPALQLRSERAVREAIEHAWATCLLPSGLWKQSSSDAGPTVGGVMARLVDASPLLEFRTSAAVEQPQLTEEVTAVGGVVRVGCVPPAGTSVAVRLYVVPEGEPTDPLADRYLAGIIQTSDGDVRTMDPLAAVRTMQERARAQWGSGGFEEYGYSAWKLGQISPTLQVSLRGESVGIVLPREGKVSLYACSVNAYGETSRPVPVRVKLGEKAEEEKAPPPEPAPAADGEAGAQPAAAAPDKPATEAPAAAW